MQVTVKELTQALRARWNHLETLVGVQTQTDRDSDESAPHFPIIIAQTTEGQIMDGPNGLRLITDKGTTPVERRPEGFLVHQPFPHILQPKVARCRFFSLT